MIYYNYFCNIHCQDLGCVERVYLKDVVSCTRIRVYSFVDVEMICARPDADYGCMCMITCPVEKPVRSDY
jgi:hypothetical protein